MVQGGQVFKRTPAVRTLCILKRWQQILNGSSKSYPGTQSSCLYLGLTPHPLERMRPVKERRQKPHSQVGKAEPNGSRKLLSGNPQIIKYTYPPPRLKPLQERASRPGGPRTRSQSRPSLPTALHPRFHCLQDFVPRAKNVTACHLLLSPPPGHCGLQAWRLPLHVPKGRRTPLPPPPYPASRDRLPALGAPQSCWSLATAGPCGAPRTRRDAGEERGARAQHGLYCVTATPERAAPVGARSSHLRTCPSSPAKRSAAAGLAWLSGLLPLRCRRAVVSVSMSMSSSCCSFR